MTPDDQEPDEQPDLGELRDELPEDLDRGFVGPYQFPDNKRRRVPGVLYLLLAAAALAIALIAGDDAVLVNRGFVVGAIGLGVIGILHIITAVPMKRDENDALVIATRAVGFPVGHASAQMGWRGFRSRPTWRVLVYSAEDPPDQRGLVLIDAYDGRVIDQLVEENPEDWSSFATDHDQ